MIKEIHYSGYATEPSDYECADGQLATSLNLINEDSQLKPLFQPKEIIQLGDGENVVLVHNTNSYSHLIIYDGKNVSAIDKDDTSMTIPFHKQKTSSTQHEEMDAIEGATLFSAIGNVLLVKTATEIYYFLWKSDDKCYLYLGTHLPELRVSCGLSYDIVRTGKNGKYFPKDPKYFYTGDDDDDSTSETAKSDSGEEDGFVVDIKHPLQNMTDDWSTTEMSADGYRTDEENITSAVLAKVNKFIQEQSTQKGRFLFPFLVRFAYRLYDDTLAMHTPPMLMIPSDACTPLVVCSALHFDGGLTDFKCICTAAPARLHVQFDSYLELHDWKDIIKSLDVFVSKPVYTYDQNGHCYRLKLLKDCNPNVIGAYKGSKDTDSQTPFWQAYYNKFKNSLNVKNNGGDTSSYSNFINNCYCVEIPKRSEEDVTSEIKDTANLYLLHSYKVDELSSDLVIVPVENDYLQSLVAREVMADDYDSHDTILPDSILSYNSRLNMGGIKKRLFGGFPPCMLAQYQHDSSKTLAARTAYVYLRMDDGIHVVKSTDSGSALSNGELVYFFYPSSRAFKAIVYDGSTYHEYNLETHGFFGNASFYYGGFHDTGKVISSLPSDSVPDADNALIDLGNKVYNSAVNNPFHFSATDIYTVGSGHILGISTAAKALSQGQFGQFPLYAFTTDGVWALEVSSTGSYSARQPITRDVCINSESITQIDDAVLFATNRGIMLIQGSQTQCITDTIYSEAPFNVLDLPCIDQLHSKLGHETDTCLPVKPFLAFLADCRMVYDYVHQRIIVYNPMTGNDKKPLYTYAYVFSLKSKQWGMMYSALKSSVNSYPDAMAMTNDGMLVSFSDTDETVCKGLYITRPLKLEAADIHKTISSLIQRGHFQRGDVATVLYGSRDLYTWRLVWSSTDHFLRGFRGTPYKYFRIAGLASLAEGKSIFGASVNYQTRLTNNLR